MLPGTMELSPYAPARFDGEMWDRCAPAPAAQPIDLRIITWNVWFGGHMFEQRGRALLAELGRRRADVIALQEVTAPLLAAIHDEPWVRAAYHVSELDLLGYDVVMLARVPVIEMRTLPLPTEMGRRLLVGRLACGLDVATVHLESMRGRDPERAEQLRIIQPALAELSDDVVLLGDMNFEPDAPLENAALDPSFVDVWPALRPDDPGFSVDSIRNPMRLRVLGKETRKRIDRVFARTRRWRPEAIELLGTAPIDDAETFVSDHFGLQVELRAT
jgi:tyrosyl-DNA phosphodiesterase 2